MVIQCCKYFFNYALIGSKRRKHQKKNLYLKQGYKLQLLVSYQVRIKPDIFSILSRNPTRIARPDLLPWHIAQPHSLQAVLNPVLHGRVALLHSVNNVITESRICCTLIDSLDHMTAPSCMSTTKH